MLLGYRYLYHLSNGIRSPLPCGNLPYVDVEHSRKTFFSLSAHWYYTGCFKQFKQIFSLSKFIEQQMNDKHDIWATYPDIAVLLNSETFEKLGA